MIQWCNYMYNSNPIQQFIPEQIPSRKQPGNCWQSVITLLSEHYKLSFLYLRIVPSGIWLIVILELWKNLRKMKSLTIYSSYISCRSTDVFYHSFPVFLYIHPFILRKYCSCLYLDLLLVQIITCILSYLLRDIIVPLYFSLVIVDT